MNYHHHDSLSFISTPHLYSVCYFFSAGDVVARGELWGFVNDEYTLRPWRFGSIASPVSYMAGTATAHIDIKIDNIKDVPCSSTHFIFILPVSIKRQALLPLPMHPHATGWQFRRILGSAAHTKWPNPFHLSLSGDLHSDFVKSRDVGRKDRSEVEQNDKTCTTLSDIHNIGYSYSSRALCREHTFAKITN